MKEELYKSKYVVFTYKEETDTFTLRHLPESEDMTDDEYKEFVLILIEYFEKYNPKYINDDDRERLYAVTPDIQQWALSKVVPAMNKIKLQKYVRILPDDFIGKLSSEQVDTLVKTKFSTVFENKFLDDYDAAIKWVNE